MEPNERQDGVNASNPVRFCTQCGNKILTSANFCPHCGAPVRRNESRNGADPFRKAASAQEGISRFAEAVSSEIGEAGKTEIHVRDLFSQVFTKHSQEEAEELFSYGTSKTTPAKKDIITTWPKPWLYSRIFFYLFLTEILLWICASLFQNLFSVPGMIFIGAMIVPFSGLIFFWEVNAPRNISIFSTVKIFFAGGAFSLLATMILYAIAGDSVNSASILSAMIVGLVEETGKMIIASRYLNKLKDKYILNGLLIGAAVGAGFAVFETAGYAMYSFLVNNYGTLSSGSAMSTLVVRSILALGGHISWTAVASAGYVAALADSKDASGVFTNRRFYFFFLLVVLLHGLWDGVTVFGIFTQIVLMVFVVAIVLILISAGMKQVSRVVREENEQLTR